MLTFTLFSFWQLSFPQAKVLWKLHKQFFVTNASTLLKLHHLLQNIFTKNNLRFLRRTRTLELSSGTCLTVIFSVSRTPRHRDKRKTCPNSRIHNQTTSHMSDLGREWGLLTHFPTSVPEFKNDKITKSQVSAGIGEGGKNIK